MIRISYPYAEILKSGKELGDSVCLVDHIGGFDAKKTNHILHILNQSPRCNRVIWHQLLDSSMTAMYPNLSIEFDADLQNSLNLDFLHNYQVHPTQKFQNFLCSFNGSPHLSRKLLVAILHRMGWFDPITCSKNFQFSKDILDGHLEDFLDQQSHRFYRHFFLAKDSENFFQTVNSFGHVRFDHNSNIHNLEQKLTESFLHIVSETMATSYYPFVTEKFLYSIVTRGLFLAYAQPGWHDHLERYYGFQKYNKIFDYRFDEIQNPVKRLVEMMSMIAKFSMLSSDDWRDLYEMEINTIEHNYNHYFSGDYLKKLKNLEYN
jgi:hypothetical protein